MEPTALNKNQILTELSSQYQIVSVIDLDTIQYDPMVFPQWIETQLAKIRKDVFLNNERILILLTEDNYQKKSVLGLKLRVLQEKLNKVDISNFFCLVVTSNPDIDLELTELIKISTDPSPIIAIRTDSAFTLISMENTFAACLSEDEQPKKYEYKSADLVRLSMNKLDNREKFLLTESKVFCMYPWIHLHVYPTGEAWPCCGADREPGPVGSARSNRLGEIWNSDGMKQLRNDMLSETWNPYCVRCYEQEKSGFVSMRKSANKHHGHNINKIKQTNNNGSQDDFQMTYWDIRFSNLCNLSCRSCGYMFSSSWHSDQVKLLGNWGEKFSRDVPVLNFAGRTEIDMWEQLVPHLDYVEQIYFAGGEPLIMEDHYKILEELVRRNRFDVRLIYNTNFTNVKLKNKFVFDYWGRFKSVSVGASLDAFGSRAEYIRKGTNWRVVEENRKQMINICPQVDFYISPTLSIMNALHLPDFHQDWVDKGLLTPQDLNINILQDPAHYRIDIAPHSFKKEIESKYLTHLEWLRPRDHLQRATLGFESAIKFMNSTDNTALIPDFWNATNQLDLIRNESLLAVIPELRALKDADSK